MSTNAGKNKVKIALIIGVFSLIVLAFVLLLLEGLGTFVGAWMNRPVAAAYIDGRYEGIEADFVRSEIVNNTVERMGIETKKKCYRFEYVIISCGDEFSSSGLSAGDVFYIETYNFEVINDGIYAEYLADRELIDAVQSDLLASLGEYAAFEENGIEPLEAYYDICIYYDEYSGEVEQRLDALLISDKIENTDCVVHFTGEKSDFEKYKEKAAVIVDFFKENKEYMPGFLQIIYYYENDGEFVMQYESQFEFYELEYETQAIINGSDMHYIVELDESQTLKLKIYNIVKNVYLIVVTVTVLALSAFWVFKKVHKLRKQGVAVNERESETE